MKRIVLLLAFYIFSYGPVLMSCSRFGNCDIRPGTYSLYRPLQAAADASPLPMQTLWEEWCAFWINDV